MDSPDKMDAPEVVDAVPAKSAEHPEVVDAVPAESAEHVVVARNPQEMREAQARLIMWAKRKRDEIAAERDDMAENLSQLRGAGWRTGSLQNHQKRLQARVEFYEKMIAALEAGYVIVPDMPAEVFAVRTKRKRPLRNETTEVGTYAHPEPEDQRTEVPPIGEGAYVNPTASFAVTRLNDAPAVAGSKELRPAYRAHAVSFMPADFPFALARPEIVESAAKAASLLLFDELAVVGEGGGPAKRPDPIVLGRIVLRRFGARWQDRRLSFLISWFVDVRTMRF